MSGISKKAGAPTWRQTVATFADLPIDAINGDVVIVLDTQSEYEFDGASWGLLGQVGGGAGDLATVLSNGNHMNNNDIVENDAGALVSTDGHPLTVGGTTVASNVAPGNAIIQAQNAFPGATGGNKSGANVLVSGGIGSRYYTVADYTAMVDYPYTIEANDNGDGTGVKVNFTITGATSNASTATAVAAQINGSGLASLLTAGAVGAAVYLTPKAGCYTIHADSDTPMPFFYGRSGAIVLTGGDAINNTANHHSTHIFNDDGGLGVAGLENGVNTWVNMAIYSAKYSDLYATTGLSTFPPYIQFGHNYDWSNEFELSAWNTGGNAMHVGTGDGAAPLYLTTDYADRWKVDGSTGDLILLSDGTGVQAVDEATLRLGSNTAASDVSPGSALLAPQNAYPRATGDNRAANDLHISGGFGQRKITITDYTQLSGVTVSLWINGTLTVLTEGVDWNTDSNNLATAVFLATAISGVQGLSAVAPADTVYITCDPSVYSFTGTTDDYYATGIVMSFDAMLVNDGNSGAVPAGYLGSSYEGKVLIGGAGLTALSCPIVDTDFITSPFGWLRIASPIPASDMAPIFQGAAAGIQFWPTVTDDDDVNSYAIAGVSYGAFQIATEANGAGQDVMPMTVGTGQGRNGASPSAATLTFVVGGFEAQIFNANAHVSFKPHTDSTSAYLFRANDDTAFVQLDSTNKRATIGYSGGSSPQHTLDVYGNAWFRNISDTTSAFQVRNSSDNMVFNVDTSNNRVAIASNSAPTVELDVTGAGKFSSSLTSTTHNLIATSNQLVLQSAGVTGTVSWTPATSNKTLTIPNVTGTAFTSGGVNTYADSLGAVAQLVGPSDQDLKFQAASGRGLALTVNASTTPISWASTGIGTVANNLYWGTNVEARWGSGDANSEIRVAQGYIQLASASTIQFGPGAGSGTSTDTRLGRAGAAGVLGLAQGNPSNACEFRVYGTSDATQGTPTNSEYVDIDWSSSVGRVGTKKTGSGTVRSFAIQTGGTNALTVDTSQNIVAAAGVGMPGSGATHSETLTVQSASELLTLDTSGLTTDTSANLLPANSIILAVDTYVQTEITGLTSTYAVGDASSSARFSSPSAVLTAGASEVGINQFNAGNASQGSAAKVRITTVGIPTAGKIRITVHYMQFGAPTS